MGLIKTRYDEEATKNFWEKGDNAKSVSKSRLLPGEVGEGSHSRDHPRGPGSLTAADKARGSASTAPAVAESDTSDDSDRNSEDFVNAPLTPPVEDPDDVDYEDGNSSPPWH